MVAACIGDPADVPTVWPPADFHLVVEEFVTEATGLRVQKRLQVWADGTVLFRIAPNTLADPAGEFVLPVFSVVSAYRLLPETTRFLARKVYRRGFMGLDGVQGDQRVTGGTSYRLHYHAFEEDKVVVASGMIHGDLVRILRAINSYLPPGEQFAPPGMVGEREPSTLRGTPLPLDDLGGSLRCHGGLAARFADDAGLQLDTFALACAAGQRDAALRQLAAWQAARGEPVVEQGPFPVRAELTRAQLERLLPPP